MEDNDLRSVIEENKSKIILLIVLILVSIGFMIGKNMIEKGSIIGSDSYSATYKKAIESMASKTYEEIIYDNLSQKDFEKYSKDGYTLTLRQLLSFYSDIKPSNFDKDGIKCNFTATQAIIYPTKKFAKKDYDVKVILSCAAEKESAKNEKK